MTDEITVYMWGGGGGGGVDFIFHVQYIHCTLYVAVCLHLLAA